MPRIRSIPIQVLVTPAERKELQKAAEQNAIATLSGYVRSRALIMARRETELESKQQPVRRPKMAKA